MQGVHTLLGLKSLRCWFTDTAWSTCPGECQGVPLRSEFARMWSPGVRRSHQIHAVFKALRSVLTRPIDYPPVRLAVAAILTLGGRTNSDLSRGRDAWVPEDLRPSWVRPSDRGPGVG
jgi:hypothetical protein